MLITFSGIDGSGKTTQANYVSVLLAESGYSIELIHMIPWTWVNKIGEAIACSPKRAATFSTDDKKPGLIKKIIKLGMMSFDLIRFRIILLSAKITKKVIVCDRYFYDLGLQARYTDTMSERILQTYWRFVPEPDYGFYLEVQPKIAEQREGDHTADYYSIKHGLYQDQKRHWRVVHVPPMNMKATKAMIEAHLKDLGASN